MVMVLCVLAGVWAWLIADVITTDFRIEAHTKGPWVAAVMVVPVVGGLAWLLHGRAMHARAAVGDLRARPYCRVIGSGAALPPTSRGVVWGDT